MRPGDPVCEPFAGSPADMGAKSLMARAVAETYAVMVRIVRRTNQIAAPAGAMAHMRNPAQIPVRATAAAAPIPIAPDRS